MVGVGDLDAFFGYRLGRDGQYTQIQGPIRPIPIDPNAELFFASVVSVSKSGQYLAVGGGIGVRGIRCPWLKSAIDPYLPLASALAHVLSPSSPLPAQQVWMYKWDKAQGICVTMASSVLVPGRTGYVALSPSGKDLAVCFPNNHGEYLPWRR